MDIVTRASRTKQISVVSFYRHHEDLKTLIMTTLQLEQANNQDILKIVRQTRTIWSGGLRRDKFIQLVQHQLTHPWGKKHVRYFLLRSGSTIVASLKLYSICISHKGKDFQLGGIGAVYTMAEHRQQGFAGTLIQRVIELARQENMDGLLLYSDIGPVFYTHLGFIELGSYNFESTPETDSTFGAQVTPLQEEHIPSLSRSYNRFLSRRQFGCQRSELFWRYKIAREQFFHTFAASEWPGVQLLTLDNATNGFTSYALIENSSKALRVLEIVGDEAQIWSQVVAYASKNGLIKIRGFEGSAGQQKCAQLVDRDWAAPMLLPLNPAVENWLDAQPCPLLELDHF
ncbi:MAG: GNAT family N-acetyltransferase [Candidatus Obscuribacterales bacterium]|nr:GNAT family N-acetyltransferase [Candidatus Obscuribacterales bacterium]